jgi:hypothetical protein
MHSPTLDALMPVKKTFSQVPIHSITSLWHDRFCVGRKGDE